tara:strand:+ start:2656 stop:3906 length:1251 start_codon:yes stop_codon:yes gene_type:complete
MNKFKKVFLSILFAFFFIFIGYENPIIIDSSKKYIKYSLKRLGVVKSFISNDKDIAIAKNNQKDEVNETFFNVAGNSYELNYEKVFNFDGRTANFFLENKDKLKFNIYLQEGINLKENFASEIKLPIDIFLKKNGGVKSVLQIKGKKYAYISNKKNINCYYASIIRLDDSKKIFSTKCLPDFDNTDFNGLGGAYVETEKHIFLSIGAPEWNSEKIRRLAQNPLFVYGKIIRFEKKSFLNDDIKQKNYVIYSSGHKNPQGMVLYDNKIFAVEHGPQGGDEINLIEKDNNYGWPLTSYGTRYNDGVSFEKNSENLVKPIFAFLPSVAPSSINKCPKNLEKYYNDNYCFLILSLRGMSVFVALLDKKKLNLISIEKFKIDQRVRHFGLNKENKIYQNDSSFYVSIDGEGIYRMKFNNFR